MSLRSVSIVILIAGSAGAAFYIWQSPSHPKLQSISVIPAIQNPTLHSSASSSTHYPVPTEEQRGPSRTSTDQGKLPTFETALSEIFGKVRFESLFNIEDIVRRIVVTVENIPDRKQPSEDISPLKPPPRGFRTTGRGDERTINPGNFKRYKPYIEAFQVLDDRKLIAVYVHFYPLFQAAYRDLGTEGYFNDRLVNVIDLLLSTPDVKEPIKIIRYGAHDHYRYADDDIESLAGAQKILVRMGNQNAFLIKGKLRELRNLLTHLKK